MLALGLLLLVMLAPFTFLMVLPYWSAERAGRARWPRPATLDASPVAHPYRAMPRSTRAVARSRAPILVRATAGLLFASFWISLLGAGYFAAAGSWGSGALALLLALASLLLTRGLLLRRLGFKCMRLATE